MMFDPSDIAAESQKTAAGCPSILERLVSVLVSHWRQSLAKIIWDDLTPFGRATIWVPLWLWCWMLMPLYFLCAVVLFVWFKLYDRCPKLPPIFFAR